MTLPASGSISTAQIRAEIGGSGAVVIPSAEVRQLTSVLSGSIVLPNDFWGKSWGVTLSVTAGQRIIGFYPNVSTETGFISGAIGSRSPTTVNGLTVVECFDSQGFVSETPFQAAQLGLQSASNPGSTFLTSIAGLAIANWNYLYAGGVARWTRPVVTFGFTNGQTNDVVIEF